jgi:hypothetical protein
VALACWKGLLSIYIHLYIHKIHQRIVVSYPSPITPSQIHSIIKGMFLFICKKARAELPQGPPSLPHKSSSGYRTVMQTWTPSSKIPMLASLSNNKSHPSLAVLGTPGWLFRVGGCHYAVERKCECAHSSPFLVGHTHQELAPCGP